MRNDDNWRLSASRAEAERQTYWLRLTAQIRAEVEYEARHAERAQEALSSRRERAREQWEGDDRSFEMAWPYIERRW